MPKKWETHWSDVGMTEEAREDRERHILTLGNLTLVTKRLNSKLKNDAWPGKRETLRQFSSLRMTTQYLDLEKWREDSIRGRGSDFAAEAITIWKRSSGAV